MRQAIKHADIVLLGADSITEKKIVNKIGSELVAETAKRFEKSVYICSSSWKFDTQSLHGSQTPIEFREDSEVWKKHPAKVNIVNPAFEKIDPGLIKGVVCEFGVLSFKRFISKVKEEILK
jgi:translation initiation factor 2B subunit (eIF-2B alpha/beta/delta family)